MNLMFGLEAFPVRSFSSPGIVELSLCGLLFERYYMI
ncbi:hypothetical protein EV194_10572 [Natronoflexus pectinivorans]|uniref:Uncharacterized protein n=1 Tax=Natronoflexus pectinivorans TaxID=682526 RepID=A0A4R2GI91_9BACT|nr:hypothetical protein EV194_10572 [Natronoflexus pectinivorans]